MNLIAMFFNLNLMLTNLNDTKITPPLLNALSSNAIISNPYDANRLIDTNGMLIKNPLGKGYQHGNIWIKIECINTTDFKHWFLSYNYRHVDTFDAWIIQNSNFQGPLKCGDLELGLDHISNANIGLPFTLNPGQKISFLIRIQTEGSLSGKFEVVEKRTYIFQNIQHTLIEGVYLGMMLCLASISMFIFFLKKSMLYLWFALSIVFLSLFQASDTTIFAFDFGPNVLNIFGIFMIGPTLTTISLLQYTHLTISQKKCKEMFNCDIHFYKTLKSGLVIQIGLAILHFCSLPFAPYRIVSKFGSILPLLGSINMILLLIIVYSCTKSRQKEMLRSTKMIISGWLTYLTGVIGLSLYLHGYLPDFFRHAPALGSISLIFFILLERYFTHDELTTKNRLIHTKNLIDTPIKPTQKAMTVLICSIIGPKEFTHHHEGCASYLTTINACYNIFMESLNEFNVDHITFIDNGAIFIFLGMDRQQAMNCFNLAHHIQIAFKKRRGENGFFDIRCGINTGLAYYGYFGDENRGAFMAVGSTVNYASQLESKANVNTILISETCFTTIGSAITTTNPRGIITENGNKVLCYEINYG